MKIISIINEKGGVGKSTTVQNLAIGLAAKGLKVGLIDMDQQAANLSFCFLGHEKKSIVTLHQVLKAVIMDKEKIVLQPEHFTPTNFDNLSILPTDSSLTEFLDKQTINPNLVLKSILPKSGFDFILIDTPGSMLISTFNALSASNQVIIVTQPEMMSLVGLLDITKSIEQIKKKLNPKLTILGIVLNMVRHNTKITKDALNWLQNDPKLSPLLFEAQIPHTQEVGNTQNDILSGIFKTIFSKKSANIGMYYSDLVNEFLKKVT